MQFLVGEALTNAIRRTVQRTPLDMVVAYWGDDAVKRLRLSADLRDCRVACDAGSGFCSPIALDALLGRGAKVLNVPRLHAKVYHSGAGMVVASANASKRGLQEAEGKFGREAGTWTDDRDQLKIAKNWLNDVFSNDHWLSLADIPQVKALWDNGGGLRPKRLSLASAILTNADMLRARTERAYIYDTEEPPPGVVDRYRSSSAFSPLTWEDNKWPLFWGELPDCRPGDTLLCFEQSKGEVEWVGAWRVLKPIRGDGIEIWPAEETVRLLDIQFGDMEAVRDRIPAAIKNGRIIPNQAPLRLSVLAEAIAA